MDNWTANKVRERMVMSERPDGPCYFCGSECSGVDDWCYGCEELVCPDCDMDEQLGDHEVADHDIGEGD